MAFLSIAYGLYQAISLAWVCDDAFISFRYAKNLVDGHGLVFNIGERVEGYTNFLWTVIVAFGMSVGIEPIIFSQFFSIAFYLLSAMALFFLSIKLTKEYLSTESFFIPIAAFAFLLHHDIHIYATSGLETSMVTALITIGFTLLVLFDTKLSFFVTGIILILAVLTRPDSIIIYVMAFLYLLLVGKGKLRNIFYYSLPFLIIYLPYWIIRYVYYGYPFPNTYYAKSANLSYYTQGLAYLWLYLKTYYVLLLLPIGTITLILLDKKNIRKHEYFKNGFNKSWLLSILFIIPYMFYIISVGGDFMFARLLIPITPLSFILIEVFILKLFKNNILRIVIGAVVLLTIVFRWNQFGTPQKEIDGIIDESSAYPEETIENAKTTGTKLKQYLEGVDVTVGYIGTQAMLMYYSELPAAIDCHAGLTDEYIAHLPLEKRGRPGHEKMAPYDYLIRRKMNFHFAITHEMPFPYNKLRRISFNDQPAFIVIYDKPVMDKLKEYQSVHFVDFPDFLDKYIQKIPEVSKERLQKDFNFFTLYYFAYNDDPERYSAFAQALDN